MQPLTQLQQDRIEAAVSAAEKRTSAEIAVVVAQTSDDYAGFPLLWAGVVALLAGGIAALLRPDVSAAALFAGEAGLYIVAASILAVLPSRARLAPAFVRQQRTEAMAELQFSARVQGRTADRVGLLLFVSLAEHVAEIRVDSRIAAVIPPAAWQAAIDDLVRGIRAGVLAEAIGVAVESCATTLAGPFPPQADQTNELADRLAQV